MRKNNLLTFYKLNLRILTLFLREIVIIYHINIDLLFSTLWCDLESANYNRKATAHYEADKSFASLIFIYYDHSHIHTDFTETYFYRAYDNLCLYRRWNLYIYIYTITWRLLHLIIHRSDLVYFSHTVSMTHFTIINIELHLGRDT